MDSQLPIIYRDVVRVAMAEMAERYGIGIDIPSGTQGNRDAWDVHHEPCFYEELEDAFVTAFKTFEATQGYRVDALFTNHPEQQMMFQSKDYICGVMQDMGLDATYDTLGAALSCASFLVHACERLIQYDAALVNSGYVDALLSSLRLHTTEAWQHICLDMIAM